MLRFAVATFGRVFDMTPQPDTLTLDELAAALTRFQLKAQLAGRIKKELDRFHRGEGTYAHTQNAQKLSASDIEHRIRREAKTDLRIWAPALFAPGARRENDAILHMSALVYDIDDRLTLAEARAALHSYWHVGHSTWSHSPEHPKFRVCIPFAQPILPTKFLEVWDHLNESIGGVADRTGRNVARGMALPAVPSMDAPRAAWVHVAPLFDPAALGLADASPHPTPEPSYASFMRVDRDELYLASEPELDTDTDDDDPWSGGAPIAKTTPARPPAPAPSPSPALSRAPSPSPAPTPAPAPDLATVLARLDQIEARLSALEKKLG